MATNELRHSGTGATIPAAILLAVTLAMAVVAGIALAGGGGSGPASGSPAELIAEKERALAAAESGGPSRLERLKSNAPDAGAEWLPGVLLGLAMVTAGAGYLLLYRRQRNQELSAASIIRGAAVVESLFLVVLGPFLAMISYVGIGD